MPELKPVKLKINKERWVSYLEFLVRNNLITFLVLIFLILILGLFIGYFYVWRVESFDQKLEVEKILKIDALKQQRVLDEWQQRNENFYTVDAKKYRNPFELKKQ